MDYIFAFLVSSSKKAKSRLFLILSIINNFGILAIFKYYNFFILQLNSGFENLGLHKSLPLLNLVLPVGISFYTFHGMSYIFDIYRNKQKPVCNFIEYATFVSFFPLLVAGPIERAHHLLPQLQSKRVFNYSQSVEGIRLIMWGLFKKLFVADNLAAIADNAFEHYAASNSITLIVGAVAFSFQIYSDFSGYSDIAIGTAKILGFELLSNFRFPYFSSDIVTFWKRWHISLTSWFKDYLYFPLGGSKFGLFKTIRNVLIVFMVSGLWHGASWNFIVWGLLHASAYIVYFLFRNKNAKIEITQQKKHFLLFQKVLKIGITFLFVTFAWVFFRANNLESAEGYLKQIIKSANANPGQLLSIPKGATAILYISPLLLGDFYFRKNERVLRIPKYEFFYYMLFAVIIIYQLLKQNELSSFIYFQF